MAKLPYPKLFPNTTAIQNDHGSGIFHGQVSQIKDNLAIPAFKTNLDAAMFWFEYGLQIIPIIPYSKQPALKWDPWLDDLSLKKIIQHWRKNPSNEVGCIVADNMVVLDTDSKEAKEALWPIERDFNFRPMLVIKTKRGYHHYFRLAPGTYVKSDAHDTAKFPDRIDIKASRGMVVLPPSTDKEIYCLYAKNVSELEAVNQDFIDAIFKHNGRQLPRPAPAVSPARNKHVTRVVSLEKIKALLDHIEPDCGYEDWSRVLMAIFHKTQGSEDGFNLADNWSSRGRKYKGTNEIETKWRSFRGDVPNPVGIGTLIMLAGKGGANTAAIMGNGLEEFEVLEDEAVNTDTQTSSTPSHPEIPLARYSLRGRLHEIEKQAVNQRPFLGNLALMGQATVWYAPPNTGKTLLTLNLLIEAIGLGRFIPEKVFYINVDDSGSGLAEKLYLAEEYGFHMLSEGYQDFKAKELLSHITEMTNTDQARRAVIILDTLKRFTDLMDKNTASRFTNTVRNFVLKGGTLLALAHTNKKPGPDGKPIYGGTTDIVDDFDCAYVMSTVSQQDSTEKVVEFSNIKCRGDVASTAAYSYVVGSGIPYHQRLASIQSIDPMQLTPLKQAVEVQSDSAVIAIIENYITDGINTKMKLADAVAERAGISKRSALQVIEKYTGADPAIHRWAFEVRHRGAKVYCLLSAGSIGLSG